MSIVWILAEIWLGYWYCRRSLKFARALRFDSELGRGAVFLLALHWPLAMFLVMAVRVSAGCPNPLFLSQPQEKKLRKRRRDEERAEKRRAAQRTWNEWNQRRTFITKLAATAEHEDDWLEQERLAAQLEFLAATEPPGPGDAPPSPKTRPKTGPKEGSGVSSPSTRVIVPSPPTGPSSVTGHLTVDWTASVVDPSAVPPIPSWKQARLTQPNGEVDEFCNICHSYRSVLLFRKAGICNVCFGTYFGQE